MSQHYQQPKCDVCSKPATSFSTQIYKRTCHTGMIEFTPIPGPVIGGCDEHPAEPMVHDLGEPLFGDW